MDDEERIRYKFFLGSGCRDKEVTFAAWSDIDFDKKTYHVRRKEDVHFTPKSHESRPIPLPDSLIALLKNRRRNAPHDRRIFVNEEARPDNHFLRKLKRIAKRAGLNCGQCRTVLTEGRYEKKKQIEVSCKDRPVCEHFYLHRFRKTCATRWHEAGIPIRTIQMWLGHQSLETTMIYLGVTDSAKLRSNINIAFSLSRTDRSCDTAIRDSLLLVLHSTTVAVLCRGYRFNCNPAIPQESGFRASIRPSGSQRSGSTFGHRCPLLCSGFFHDDKQSSHRASVPGAIPP